MHSLARPLARRRPRARSSSLQVSLSLLVGVQAMLLSPKNPGTHDVLQASGGAGWAKEGREDVDST